MAEAAADVGAGEVVGHQEGVDGEGQIVHAVADIDPVRGKHLDSLPGKVEGIDNLCCRITDSFDEVGVL